MQKIQSTFQGYNLNLYSKTDKSLHIINRVSGNIGWKREGNNQVVAGDDLLIDLPSHLWPVTSFYAAFTPDANGQLLPRAASLGYIDLNDIQSFLFSSPPLLPAKLQQDLKQLQLKGFILNADAAFTNTWNDWQHVLLKANFNHVTVSPWQNLPGVNNLTGVVSWNGNQGELLLQSNQLALQYNSVFAEPLNIDQLSGTIQYQPGQHNAWVVTIPSLQMLNHDAAANLSGTLTMQNNSAPVADLKANVTVHNVSHISRYLPMHAFSPKLSEWLKQAFLSGEVKSANAVLHGALNDFPFDHGNGMFSVSGVVNNIDLHYAPDWPVLKHITGAVAFTGRQLTIDADHAQMLSIPLTKIHAVIPYLGDDKPAILQVKSGDITADFAQGMEFVHASPLENTLGKMFTGVTMHGPFGLKLGLIVPLGSTDDIQIQGDMAIQNTVMDLVPWGLTLNHLNGQLHFTQDTIDAKNIQAQLFNKPLQFSLSTRQKSKNVSIVQADFTNHVDMSDLEAWLKIPFSQIVTGATDVKGKVDFSFAAPMLVHLNSNLVGLTINLPNEYAKKISEARNFSADIIVQQQQPLRVKLSYGELVNAALILNRKHEEFNLVGANLHLGVGEATWPVTPGLYITGNFDSLDWDKIKSYLSQSSGTKLPGLPLRGIDIRVGTLDLAGQLIKLVRMQLTPTASNWNVNISSPDIIGQIQVPINFVAKGLITAVFQRLNLHSAAEIEPTNTAVDLKSLPPISFLAKQVTYNALPLGQVSFTVAPSSSGLTIKTLKLVSSHLSLQATGDWSRSNETHLKGRADSNNVSALLNSLGVNAHNFIASDGNVIFDLNWHDAPYAPQLSSLNGKAALDIGRGQIVNVGAATNAKMDLGRMLSIFSLQTIPRRLTFDFSDIFQKGYSFDDINGDFTLQNGTIYTSNLHFDGPVAGLGISGNIGLQSKTYDFLLSVTPHVGVNYSIPIAATLLGQPEIGLAALAVNTIMGSQISKATTYHYAVKGPWSNPSWTSVNVSDNKK